MIMLLWLPLILSANGFLPVFSLSDFYTEFTTENIKNTSAENKNNYTTQVTRSQDETTQSYFLQANAEPVNYEAEHKSEDDIILPLTTTNDPKKNTTIPMITLPYVTNKTNNLLRSETLSTTSGLSQFNSSSTLASNNSELIEMELATPATIPFEEFSESLSEANFLQEKLNTLSTDLITEHVDDLEITEDPVEKQINEAINLMPKIPELVLSDNKTHFKFYKDSEEMLIDERITQIARQLAETSLRKQYEEQKLGHFLPISLRSFDQSSSSYYSKSLKTEDWKRQITPNTSSTPAPVEKISQVKIIPIYIYKESLVSKSSTKQDNNSDDNSNHSFPDTRKKVSLGSEIYNKVTNQLAKITKLIEKETLIKKNNEVLKIKNDSVTANIKFRLSIPTFSEPLPAKPKTKVSNTPKNSETIDFSDRSSTVQTDWGDNNTTNLNNISEVQSTSKPSDRLD